MSVPVWVLLAFAAWTLVTLMGSVGIYRWSRILTGRASLNAFEEHGGNEWYRRAMQAHANCIENLPVYAAIVVAVVATGIETRLLDYLAMVLMVARVCHTLVHIIPEQTNVVVGFRFAFFFTQVVCMFCMGAIVAVNAL
jgi:uncharacterized MAPEG superfamily protein